MRTYIRQNRSQNNDEVGQDSFLDTTANLVGILIILVVVVGAKTRIDAEEFGRKESQKDLLEGLEQPRAEANAAFQALQKLEQDQKRYELENEYRRRERDKLLEKVQTARRALEFQTKELDERKQSELQQQQQLVEKKKKLESKISNVAQKIGAAQETKRPEIVLEHLPTPMARTVFTREMHVQLSGGKISVIPWERLVQALRNQVPLAVQRKSRGESFEDLLGPISGFIMRYQMNRVSGGYELDRFELETTSSVAAENMEEAFSVSGRLRLELASRDPAETVVTIWVYPDSFAEFRELKARLFDEGFLSAARPLPKDVRIGASPQGSRSAAQ